MLRILHLSDLHLDISKYDQEIVIRSLLIDLQSQAAKFPIDVVVFSGDLTNRGSTDEFAAAGGRFLDQVLSICGIQKDRLLLIPGNHDIQKDVVDSNPYVEAGLTAELSSLDKINSFVDKVSRSDQATLSAFARLENYEKFVRSYLTDVPDYDLPLVKIHKKLIQNLKVGFACFNTAWRCTGIANDADKGKLLLGERTVDLALDQLNETDLNIAIFHHPLQYLASFEANATEARLVVGFDLLLFGHVHSARPMTRQSPIGGAFYGQSGCLYSHRDYHNSYQIIEIDNMERKGTVIGRSYFNAHRAFRPAVDVLDADGRHHFDLPVKVINYEDIDKVLAAVRPFIRLKANKHVTLDAAEDQPLDDINRVFVCPPMRFGALVSRVVKSVVSKAEACTADSILSSPSNFIIYGPRESGKTSLAHFISLKFAEGFGDCRRIPTIIDARLLKPTDYALRKSTASFYHGSLLTITRTDDVLSKFPLIILLDNFNGEEAEQCAMLEWLMLRPNTRIVCFQRENLGTTTSLRASCTAKFRAVHLETLPRNSIRQLSASRVSGESKDKDVFDSVMQSLVSAQLPWNGYIVSLLLWAYQQNKTFERLNEAVLIENLVSYLLDKGSFSYALRKTFDPRSKEIILQALAVEFTRNSDAMDEAQLYEFVFRFFARKRLEFSAPIIIAQLIEVGILSKENASISFRFRCYQEYFFARALSEDPDLFNTVNTVKNMPLYAREIDLLTALTRRSLGLLNTVYKWVENTRLLTETDAKAVNLSTASLRGTGHVGLSSVRRGAIRKEPMSDEQVDAVFEKAEKLALQRREERHKHVRVNGANGGPKNLLGAEHLLAVETLGKIIRNAEFDDADYKIPALYLFVSSSDGIIGRILSMIEEIIEVFVINEKEFSLPVTATDLNDIFNSVRVGLPAAFAGRLAEQVGSEKLVPTIRDVYSEYDGSFGPQFLLASLLLDLGATDAATYMENLARLNPRPLPLHLIHEKLSINYTMRRFKEESKTELENAIASVGVMLGESPQLKGHRLARIRRHASLRDL
jgi:predicted MPP superfamily phosphohydrolase